MAKKKANEDGHDIAANQTSEIHSPQDFEDQQQSPRQPDQNHQLMEEIQTFMAMRDELAQKLASEIEATEARLEELKRTAASLFPQANEASEEKKAKKTKPKQPKEAASSAEAA